MTRGTKPGAGPRDLPVDGARAVPGTVYLVGAGPGDPDLLTVRGLELLRSADVVLHDELVPTGLLEEASGAVEYVGKRGREPKAKDLTQATIDQKMVAHALAGRSVVRLKGGDPYLFGRGSEEARVLVRAGVPFEVVPGVTSPLAVAAYAGFSLTHRDLASSVTLVSATTRDGASFDFGELAGLRGTLCVLMGHRRLAEVCRALIERAGRSETARAAVVRAGTRPDQIVIEAPLGEIASRPDVVALESPVTLFVGDVLALRDELRWFDARPLFGKRVLSLRAPRQAGSARRELHRRGAVPLVQPLIETRALPLSAAHAALFREGLAAFDAVVFTSETAVDGVFRELTVARKDLRALGGGLLVAIGPATARALEERGAVVDLVAASAHAEGLVAALVSALEARGGVVGRRILLPRAEVAREVFPAELRARGAQVEVVPVYETVAGPESAREAVRRTLDAREADVVLLTSSSIASAFADLVDEAPDRTRGLVVASIGPVTTRTAAARGLEVTVTAERSTMVGLLDAVEATLR